MPLSKPIFPALTRASEVKPQTTQTHFRHTLQFFLLSSAFSLNPQPFPYPHLFRLPPVFLPPAPFSLTPQFSSHPRLFPLPSTSPLDCSPRFFPTKDLQRRVENGSKAGAHTETRIETQKVPQYSMRLTLKNAGDSKKPL